MRFRSLAFAFTLALLFLVPSCATRPQFNTQTNSGLVVGATSLAEATKTLGAPDNTDEIKNSAGHATLLTYWYVKVAENGDVVHDLLRLTFKTNILDSYCFQNVTGKPIWRGINLEKSLAGLTKGTSTKTDVVNVFGKPTGNKACHSINNDLGDAYRNGHELWYWTQSLQGQRHYRLFVIEFDEKGVVVDFEETESEPNTPLNRVFGK